MNSYNTDVSNTQNVANAYYVGIPPAYICPISMEIMSDPVMAHDGYTYDRCNIEKWFKNRQGRETSPNTGIRISTTLIPNYALRNAIEGYIQTHPQLFRLKQSICPIQQKQTVHVNNSINNNIEQNTTIKKLK